jgi:DNA-binding NtrC family response regulator
LTIPSLHSARFEGDFDGIMNILSTLQNMKILLVDDDEWIRDSLCLLLEAEGCELLALETAEEGLKALEYRNYDIIISDYKLPGMDGLEFLRQIQVSHPSAVKILITAYMNESLVSEGRKIGVQDFIAKPFSSETIEASLARLAVKR